MTSAYVLILAVLVLGGLLATLGDRLGTKVGKARLSLFKLRPRQTATVVTIVTGIVIAASTLGILFALSESLRVGVFRLDDKLKQLRQVSKSLTDVTNAKERVEAELAEAREEQIQAQQQLDAINQSLQSAIEKQTQTQARLQQTQTELQTTQSQLAEIETDYQQAKTQLSAIESKFERTQNQLQKVSQEAQIRRREVQNLENERSQLTQELEQVRFQIEQRDRELARTQGQLERQKQQLEVQELELLRQQIEVQRQELAITRQQQEIQAQTQQIDRQKQQISQQTQEIQQQKQEIQQQEANIASQKQLLGELAQQQAVLQREVQILERDFQLLREGTVALRRNQVLASGVVRVLKPEGAREAARQLLLEANRAALEMIQPGTPSENEWAIAIPEADLEQLIQSIDDGKDYVVRILSAANYLLGEKQVDVFADVVVNQAIFQKDEVVASASLSGEPISEKEIQERLDLLIAAANFRARRSGIVADTIQIGDGSIARLIEFMKGLSPEKDNVVLQAIAAETAYTIGPLRIQWVVVQNGQPIFRSE
ncbi:DUF3084 domain-containing protein [Oxynema sp. CENA135]|uniref:DUF3084 domain-containing protein n=1 Tax=Oxynema sp. CENA135 TaxID=984206 RepID=UPI00190D4654|nr:DUF3084 domain-containing protein [Oxynema sp. CENA135]MBK4728630.1 DUF3084 domain-containing protein [Oxynema sp. CENA135]